MTQGFDIEREIEAWEEIAAEVDEELGYVPIEPEYGEDADPNADLIGYEMDSDRGRIRIMGTSTACGPAYVETETIDNLLVIRLSVKPAGLVRAHKLRA